MDNRSLAILALVLLFLGILLSLFVSVNPSVALRGVVISVFNGGMTVVDGSRVNVILDNSSFHVGQSVRLNGYYDGKNFVVR
ncbi:hypothetical protein HY483_02270 [Candidatus Woesearchaeota archaeon]|nr:hypothetical protein [Candidatus Woesearchaeota archaeon]